MKPETEQAIRFLREKIRAKEAEATELKKVVNGFYTDENEPAPYTDLSTDNSAALGSLRSDHFYGQTVAEAAEAYLKMRKASGLSSASVSDIYAALKEGGYNFDTANENYAKNGVRISLSKNPTIFHKLPGGDWGLCDWYGIKGKAEESHAPRKKTAKHRHAAKPKAAPSAENKHATAKEVHTDTNGAASKHAITAASLEQLIRDTSRRMKNVMEHFGVDESTVSKLLEPASKVYLAERGWLKVRG